MTEKQESTVKIGVVAVFTVVAVIMGFFFLSILNHEGRLTKAETKFEFIAEKLDKIDQNLSRHVEKN